METFIIVKDFFILMGTIIGIYLESIYALIFGRKEKNICGQTVAITGAGNGFGRELAILLSERGANIAIIDVDREKAEEVALFISSTRGVRSIAFQCDVRSSEAVRKTFDQIKESLGEIDILINNAGITNCQPLTVLTEAQIENTFQVNIFAHFWSLKAVLPEMLARRKGHIVSISSSAGLTGAGNLTDYCSSKFASVGLMRALEIELLETGFDTTNEINLTTVCPLMMSTGMFQGCSTRFPRIFNNMNPVDCAQKAVNGILTNQCLVMIPKHFELFHRLTTLHPSKVGTAIQQFLGYRIHRHN
jgi:NAD(P)-dependent dehydrogenase (short-subunit alcohol dehydrogenase family)